MDFKKCHRTRKYTQIISTTFKPTDDPLLKVADHNNTLGGINSLEGRSTDPVDEVTLT